MTRPRRILRPASADPGPFDPAAFPGVDARRRAAGGPASARWRALLEDGSQGAREGGVADLNQTAASLLRAEVEAAGGLALVAGDIGPSGAIMAPIGTLDYEEAGDRFPGPTAGARGGPGR